jgi:hypothetical protein
LIQNEHFPATFCKLIGKRTDFPFGEIEIIQVDVQDLVAVKMILFYIIEQKGGFANAPEPFDTNQLLVPVDTIHQLPFDGIFRTV